MPVARIVSEEARLLESKICAAIAGSEGQGHECLRAATRALEPSPSVDEALRRVDLLEFAGHDVDRARRAVQFDAVFPANARVDLAVRDGHVFRAEPCLHEVLLGEAGEYALERRIEMSLDDEIVGRHGVSYPRGFDGS